MNPRIPLLSMAAFLVQLSAFGQQEPLLTQYTQNQVLYNPAAAGMQPLGEAGFAHHRQWLRLPDQTRSYPTLDLPEGFGQVSGIGPVTSAMYVNLPVFQQDCGKQKFREGGVFFSAMHDRLAYEENVRLAFGAAWALRIKKDMMLRAGISGQWLSKSFRTENLRAMTNPDPLIPAGRNPTDQKSNLAAGLMLQMPSIHGLNVGLAVSGLLPSDFTYLNLGGGTTRFRQVPHIYLHGNMVFRSNAVEIEPMWMLRTAGGADGGLTDPQLDAQTLMTWKSRFSAGAGLRVQAGRAGVGMESLHLLMAIYPLKGSRHLRIGYSYDLTLQSLRLNSSGTHAIQLTIVPRRPAAIRLGRNCQSVDHPRRLDPNPYPAF